jgi:hypothetical protein
LKWSLSTVSTTLNTYLLSGLAVEAAMSIGVHPITNTTVPLYNLGPTFDPEVEIGGHNYAGDPANFSAQVFGCWKFDEPFYLERERGLSSSYDTGVGASTITVSADFRHAGLLLPKKRSPFRALHRRPILPTRDDPRATRPSAICELLPINVRVAMIVARSSRIPTRHDYVDPNTRYVVLDRSSTLRDSQGTPP